MTMPIDIRKVARSPPTMAELDNLEYYIKFPKSNFNYNQQNGDCDYVFVVNEEKLPVILLFGWAGCQDRYLAKYSQIYEEKGFISENDANLIARKTLKKAVYPEMETALYRWLVEQNSTNAPLSYAIFISKAKELFLKCYGHDNFNASKGWITNFRKRHGLRTLTTTVAAVVDVEQQPPKPPPTDDETAFNRRILDKMSKFALAPSQVYNAAKTTLYWNRLPNKLPTSSSSLKFLACCNSDGSHKLKLLLVGDESDRSQENFVNSPDVDYKSNLWIASDLFVEWFHSSFVEQVRTFLTSRNLPPKALLLIDYNQSVATEEELISDDGKIVTIISPPNRNVPINQIGIHCVKIFYRKSFLCHALSFGHNWHQFITLNEAISFLYNAWQNVSIDVFDRYWTSLLTNNENVNSNCYWMDDLLQEILDMLEEIHCKITNDELNKWINDEVVALKTEHDDEYYEEKEEEEEEESQMNRHLIIDKWVNDELALKSECDDYEEKYSRFINHSSIVNSFNVCLKWAEENHANFSDVAVLNKLKERAFLMERKNLMTNS